MTKDQRMVAVRWLSLLLVIGLSVLLYFERDNVRRLQALGYPGIFLVSMLSNATLILPVPGVVFTSVMGAILNPYLVALAAGTGATLGELSGYLAGFSGQPVAQKSKRYLQLEGWMRKYGEYAVLVLAFIPNPFFDVGGIIAGALKMPVRTFLIFCWVGKTLKMLVFAVGGAYIFSWLPWMNLFPPER